MLITEKGGLLNADLKGVLRTFYSDGTLSLSIFLSPTPSGHTSEADSAPESSKVIADDDDDEKVERFFALSPSSSVAAAAACDFLFFSAEKKK